MTYLLMNLWSTLSDITMGKVSEYFLEKWSRNFIKYWGLKPGYSMLTGKPINPETHEYYDIDIQ